MKTLTCLPTAPRRIRSARAFVALAALLGALLVWGTGIGGAAPLGQVTLFTSGLSASTVMGSAGPDGNIWFVETHNVGKITPAGVITEYSAGLNPGNSLYRMGRAGHDGNMWFSDRGTTKAIGRITTDGVITEFSAGLNPGSNPGRLQPGPDGNMWFVDQGTTKALGFITPAGQITEIPTGGTTNPNSVRTGPDGNVWFTDQGTPKAIGVINPATHAVQEFSAGLNPGSFPQIIETGSDGGMWFSDSGNPTAAGRIDPSTHVIQEFSAGLTPGGAPNGITLGADGNIWLAEPTVTKLARVTPDGTITEYPTGNGPSAVASGADGNLWFGGVLAVGQFGIGAPAASIAPPSIQGPGTWGIPQSCGGDQWSTWAGRQPSHDAESWDGYTWLRDGAPIADASGQSYAPAVADVGHQLTCVATVTYTLLGVTVAATSAAVTVGYTTTVDGRVDGPLHVGAGESVQLGSGADVHGPVTVDAGGALDVEGASIHGPLRADGAAAVRICDASVMGPVEIRDTTGSVVVGDGGSCGPNSIHGPVRVTDNDGGTSVVGNTVHGPLTVTGNSGVVVDSPNTVHGPTDLQ